MVDSVRNSPSGKEVSISGGGINPPAGQISGTTVDPTIVGITTSDNDELSIGSITNGTWLRRVGTAIVGISLVASLVGNDSGVAGTSVADALDTLSANNVPTSRTVSTTAPLTGGGDLSTNRTFAINAVSNTSSGVAPQHAGASDVGNALIATSTASAWGTDFGSKTLTTTGDFVSNVGTGGIRLGLVAGSGSGVQSAASAGNIRGARGSSSTGFLLALRNNGDTADISGLQWDSSGNILALGQSGAGGNTTLQLNCITSVSIRRSNATVMATFAAGGLSLTCTSGGLQFNSNTTVDMEVNFQGAGNATGLNLTVRAQPGTTTGGRATIIGGDATNASSTGGAVLVQTGAGGSGGSGGAGALAAGQTGTAVNRFRWNDTGIGLYNTAPVAQASRVGQLTDSSTGSASSTINDVGAAFSQATLNNNFASLTAKINGIETAIHNIGLTA